MMRWVEGHHINWDGRRDLQRYFNDFLLAQTFPNAFDPHEMPPAWRQAMEILGGIVLRNAMRGAVGSAAMIKWR